MWMVFYGLFLVNLEKMMMQDCFLMFFFEIWMFASHCICSMFCLLKKSFQPSEIWLQLRSFNKHVLFLN